MDCLICLEPVDLEQGTALPCKCSHSVYHTVCINKFVNSGQNKNFCPHCRAFYPLVAENTLQQPRPQQPRQQLVEEQELPQEVREIRLRIYTYIVHILSNTFLNIINISLSGEHEDRLSNLLLTLYFLKVVFNALSVIMAKKDIEKIETALFFSYMMQFVIFIMLICLLAAVRTDLYAIVTMVNNILFCLMDIGIRIVLSTS
jgi:hypothetical protein